MDPRMLAVAAWLLADDRGGDAFRAAMLTTTLGPIGFALAINELPGAAPTPPEENPEEHEKERLALEEKERAKLAEEAREEEARAEDAKRRARTTASTEPPPLT